MRPERAAISFSDVDVSRTGIGVITSRRTHKLRFDVAGQTAGQEPLQSPPQRSAQRDSLEAAVKMAADSTTAQ